MFEIFTKRKKLQFFQSMLIVSMLKAEFGCACNVALEPNGEPLTPEGLDHVRNYLQAPQQDLDSLTQRLRKGETKFYEQFNTRELHFIKLLARQLDAIAEDLLDARISKIERQKSLSGDEQEAIEFSLKIFARDIFRKINSPISNFSSQDLLENMLNYVHKRAAKGILFPDPNKTSKWNHPLFFREFSGTNYQQYFAYGNKVFPSRLRNRTKYLVYLGERFAIEDSFDGDFYINYQKKVVPLRKVDTSNTFVARMSKKISAQSYDPDQEYSLFLVEISKKEIPICSLAPTAPLNNKNNNPLEGNSSLQNQQHVCNNNYATNCKRKYPVITKKTGGYLLLTQYLDLAWENPQMIDNLLFEDLQFP